ncbi:hypothetical protein DFQ28_008547 [Apophysomyces sp. BC1034]|nr:hypothetical protein DFQ29_007397 [Apophysomyces sp. BC1021]KAG0185940.1 hypothetical protein DFQ28_008547 [Apophysomyces sp. BC1034]
MAQDVKIRAIAIAVMNTSSSLMYTWAPLVLWPVTDAPYYRTGFAASVVFICLYVASMGLIGFFHRRDRRAAGADEVGLLEDEAPTDDIMRMSNLSVEYDLMSETQSPRKHEEL